MGFLPDDALQLDLEESTVDFYEFHKENVKYYYFDSSESTPPHPMVNAILGLKLLDKNSRLIMINHQIPNALLTRVGNDFEIDILPLDNGKIKLEFSFKEGASQTAELKNTCGGC